MGLVCGSTSEGASTSLWVLHMLAREMLPRELLSWCRQAAPRRLDLLTGQQMLSLLTSTPHSYASRQERPMASGLKLPQDECCPAGARPQGGAVH